MKGSLLFAVAGAMLSMAAWLLPRTRRHWADAMRAEMAEAVSGRAAASFAFGCLCAVLRSSILEPLADAGRKLRPMPLLAGLAIRPRFFAMICAVVAVSLGLVYLTAAGAPLRLMVVNAVALVIGFAALALVLAAARSRAIQAGLVSLLLGAALMGVSLFGLMVEGASRWVSIAGFVVQPSLIIVPLLLIYCARARDAAAMIGVIVAAIAVALQPDRSMAAVIVMGLGALALHRLDAQVATALAVAVAGLGWTLGQGDTLPAMPYVDQVVYTAFSVHLIAGLAVSAGLVWMLLPAIVGHLADPAHQEAYAVFGAVWLAVIAAAMLGNYPTPLVGYGASAIIGYAVSLSGLPVRGRGVVRSHAGAEDDLRATDESLLRLRHA